MQLPTRRLTFSLSAIGDPFKELTYINEKIVSQIFIYNNYSFIAVTLKHRLGNCVKKKLYLLCY